MAATLRGMDPLLALALAALTLWAASQALDLLWSALVAVVLFGVLVGFDEAFDTLRTIRTWLAP